MLIQRAGSGMLPPPGFTIPPWATLAAQWDAVPPPTTPHATLGPCVLTIGHEDQEPDDLRPDLAAAVAGHEFGWDNEHPRRQVEVGEFKIEWRPVTNGEFYAWYVEKGKDVVQFPASFSLQKPDWNKDSKEVRFSRRLFWKSRKLSVSWARWLRI